MVTPDYWCVPTCVWLWPASLWNSGGWSLLGEPQEELIELERTELPLLMELGGGRQTSPAYTLVHTNPHTQNGTIPPWPPEDPEYPTHIHTRTRTHSFREVRARGLLSCIHSGLQHFRRYILGVGAYRLGSLVLWLFTAP